MSLARGSAILLCIWAVCGTGMGRTSARADDTPPVDLSPFFRPLPEFADAFSSFRSPLVFDDGRRVGNAFEWSQRRREIRAAWDAILGSWPALVPSPRLEIVSSERRESFMQHRVRVQVAAEQVLDGYLLVPDGTGPFPAVFVPYYEPETSIGLRGEHRDFALQFTRRGFVSLAVGSPGGDARLPDRAGARCQPLSYLGCIAANCHTALAARDDVDPRRIGIVGHSYGGKWALFGSCLDDRYACAAWCDPGIVFDETRGSVNYQEPWYLGLDAGRTRQPGLVTPNNPRTGAYAELVARGRDLHELHALMAPRPFLVSGGSEDPPARWAALNHTVAVNELLGVRERVAMANRPAHPPTPESNAQIVAFFERFLGERPAAVVAVAHRGLMLDTPENTLPNFSACLDAHLGFEFDVRRTSDGALVCIHDDTLDRTTDGTGPVSATSLDELRSLDAGGWFAPAFVGTRVPTVDEIMAQIAAHPAAAGLYAVDIKADDDEVERDLVAIAGRHGVLHRLLFIGRAIDHPDVRRRLRGSDAGCRVAALASRREDLPDAVAAADADWVYVRFVPTPDETAAIRAAGRRTIVAGPAVAGAAEGPWRSAVAADVAAVLTDHPIALRRVVESSRTPIPLARPGSAP